MEEKQNWTMTVKHNDGRVETFKGKRTLKEILIGVRDYLLKIRDNKRER